MRVRRRTIAVAFGVLGACTGPHGASTTVDASASDASADAIATGAWTSDPPCTASANDIYQTPALPPLTPALRGTIVRCALGDLLPISAVQAALDADGAERIVASTGVRIVKLAYRTVRSDGTAAVSTATAYLPLVPRALPAPVILVGRSTAGIADDCAPSKEAHPQANQALPFAAHGFVTITPDFAGLGNEGAHAYLDNHEAAAELFDAARAAQLLVPGGLVGSAVAALGYSQGGGVVLSAQALEYTMTGQRTLRAVAAIALEWPISSRSFDYEEVMRNPDGFTGLAGLAPPVVTVLRHYGFLMNRMGAAQAGASFPSAERASIISAIESRCTIQLGGALNAQQSRLGDLVDATFRAQVLACIDGVAGCAGNGAAFYAWLTADFVTSDPAGARVMIAHGLADQVMPADAEASCAVTKLRAEGVQPTLCIDASATHDTVLERRIEDVVEWIEAVVDGTPEPTCGSQTLPACSR